MNGDNSSECLTLRALGGAVYRDNIFLGKDKKFPFFDK